MKPALTANTIAQRTAEIRNALRKGLADLPGDPRDLDYAIAWYCYGARVGTDAYNALLDDNQKVHTGWQCDRAGDFLIPVSVWSENWVAPFAATPRWHRDLVAAFDLLAYVSQRTRYYELLWRPIGHACNFRGTPSETGYGATVPLAIVAAALLVPEAYFAEERDSL